MPTKILRFEVNDVTLRRRIAELAKDSSNILMTSHARQRMKTRRILLTQVRTVLLKGQIVEPAHQDIHGYWKCTLKLTVAGDSVRVVAALGGRENKVVVITVMH